MESVLVHLVALGVQMAEEMAIVLSITEDTLSGSVSSVVINSYCRLLWGQIGEDLTTEISLLYYSTGGKVGGKYFW